ncbi:oligosaccharide repeat unit polymerase [Leptospira yasudae]|uniref:O-antigen polymerase n=1 Tax=Leptospira yasudae TaxID=2202201 RepID=UPI001082EDEF|nr:O-antigen polymerase [Leptospira yasudae]TGK24541.1 oligosaccharide repeat unit polymerase [Leptospira yasudae]TGM05673.1 oligosaccharide repeat unit polymerase [Leptospira yasudae]
MSLIIFAFGVLNLSLSYLFLRKISWVLLLIQAYWFFWMFLSSFSLTGLFIPSDFTYYLYISLLSSVTIGAGLYRLLNRKDELIRLKPYSFFKISIQDKEKYFFYGILVFIFPIVFFFLSKSIYMNLQPDAMPPAMFRAAAYGVYGESVLFGKNKYLYYYSLAVLPMILASLFIGAAFYLRLNRLRILILASVLIAMDAIMMLGRFGFYYILIVALLILMVKVFRNWKSVLQSLSIVKVIGVAAIFVLIFFVGAMRNSERKINIKEIVHSYVIDYHTESFSMFDHELKDEKSLLHERTYGRSSLGGLERGFSFALGLFRIPIQIQVQSDLIGGYLHKNRLLGYTSEGVPKEYNAFGSVLFSLYKDGGIPFTIFMGLVFGFFLTKFSKAFITLNPYRFSLLASLLFIGIFGIFQPVLGGPILLSVLLINVFWVL